MSVVWSATSPVSGRYSGVETRSDFADLSDCFNELRAKGQGYLEVAPLDSGYPLLTLGFRDDRAVIHVFESADRASLLMGDGTVPTDVTVDVLIMEDLSEFTADVIMSIDRAWDVVCDFVRTGSTSDLGERFDL